MRPAFERHVRANSIPVLLDVWAPWCGPCRTMAPAFERAATALEPDVRLLKLNADTAQATCARLGVRGIPAMFLFQGGRVIAQTSGAMNADAIVRWARGNLASHRTLKENAVMTIDRAVLAFAGIVVLLSALLVWLVSPWWLLLTAFVGANLMQASITGFCPAAMVFKALGAKPGAAFQ